MVILLILYSRTRTTAVYMAKSFTQYLALGQGGRCNSATAQSRHNREDQRLEYRFRRIPTVWRSFLSTFIGSDNTTSLDEVCRQKYINCNDSTEHLRRQHHGGITKRTDQHPVLERREVDVQGPRNKSARVEPKFNRSHDCNSRRKKIV